MVHCVISNCKSCHGKSANGEKVSFHKFPLAKKLRLEWERRVGRKNLKCAIQSNKTARLCSLHFAEDCYSVSRTTATSMGHTFVRWKLKDDAVPTLFNNQLCVEGCDAHKFDDVNMDVSEAEQKSSSLQGEVMKEVNQSVINTVSNHAILKTSNKEAGGKLVDGNEISCKVSTIAANYNILSSDANNVFKKGLKTISQGKGKVLNYNSISKTDCSSEKKFKSTQEESSEKKKPAICEKLDDQVIKDSPVSNVKGVDNRLEEIHTGTPCLFIKPDDGMLDLDQHHRESSFYCEGCGLICCDDITLNQHLTTCKLNNSHVDRKPVKNISSNTPLQISLSDKSSQKDRAADRSKITPIRLSDFESLSTLTFFICACGFTACGSEELVAHSSVHLTEETFACAVCNDVFHNFLLLQQHVHRSKHYWSYEGKLPSATAVSRQQPASIAVPAPGLTSKSYSNPSLSSHVSSKTHNYNSDHDYISDSKGGAMDLTINGLEHVGGSLKCGLCPFSSSSARDLLNHRKVHLSFQTQKPAILDENLVGTKRKSNSIATNDTELLRCDFCSYSTKSAIELLQHKTFHSSVGPFRCNLCSYATTSAIYLLQHKKEHSCSSIKDSSNPDQHPSIKPESDISTSGDKG